MVSLKNIVDRVKSGRLLVDLRRAEHSEHRKAFIPLNLCLPRLVGESEMFHYAVSRRETGCFLRVGQ